MPLVLLLLTGAAGVGTGVYVNKVGTEAADMEPKIGGIPAVPLLGGLGLLAAFMGGSFLAPLGMAVAVGALVSGQNVKSAKEGLDAIVTAKIKSAMAQIPQDAPAPPALPGPVEQPRNGPLAQFASQAFQLLRPGNADA